MKKLLLLLLFTFFIQCLSSQVPTIEREALIALYDSTDGANWKTNTNWNTATPVATWYGITVENITGQDHVTKIAFIQNDLNGNIPTEFGNLSELTLLEIAYEELLTGSIPSELGNLLKLDHLSLYENNLTGVIPPELGNCINLKRLFLEENQLTGNIPLSFQNLNKMISLTIEGNQFSGTIPTIFANWSELQYFSIGVDKTIGLFNNFSGDLDLSSSPSLRFIKIYNNDIATLNIKNGNNSIMASSSFDAKNNPNLSCVIVDDPTFSVNTWTNIDSSDVFIGSVGECATLTIKDELNNYSTSVFPNPTNGQINVSNNLAFPIENVSIINSLGQQILKTKFKHTIDISYLTKGIYFISFEFKNGYKINSEIIKK